MSNVGKHVRRRLQFGRMFRVLRDYDVGVVEFSGGDIFIHTPRWICSISPPDKDEMCTVEIEFEDGVGVYVLHPFEPHSLYQFIVDVTVMTEMTTAVSEGTVAVTAVAT